MTSIRAWRSGFVSAVVLLASVLAAEAPAATVSFTARRDFAIGTVSPESVAVGDFNGDGVTDLAVAAGGILILLGNGDGTFQPPVSYTSDRNTTGVSVSVLDGDFNADGVPHLAAAEDRGRVSVGLGNGDGTIQAAVALGGGRSP